MLEREKKDDLLFIEGLLCASLGADGFPCTAFIHPHGLLGRSCHVNFTDDRCSEKRTLIEAEAASDPGLSGSR